MMFLFMNNIHSIIFNKILCYLNIFNNIIYNTYKNIYLYHEIDKFELPNLEIIGYE